MGDNFFCYQQFNIHHPESADLAFLYGTILTDGRDAHSEEPTTNICVFADAQVLNLQCLAPKPGNMEAEQWEHSYLHLFFHRLTEVLLAQE